MRLYTGLLDAIFISEDGEVHKGYYMGWGKFRWEVTQMGWVELLDFVLENGLKARVNDDDMLRYVGLGQQVQQKEMV